MIALGRLLVIIAAAIFAAQPVMACCLTGHSETQIAQVSAEPPCHGDANDAGPNRQTHDQNTSDASDCPGCLDCDSAIMQTQSQDDLTVLASASLDLPIQTLEARFSGFEHRLVVRTTGPPRDPPARLLTPVTLKQRFLT